MTSKNDEQSLAELRKATSGRFYMSESDYPFELVSWDSHTEVTPEFLRKQAKEAEDSAVQEVELDNFLQGRLQNILETLRANLTELKAYKVGRINMPAYVVGRSPQGTWLGISTRVVET